MNLLLLLASFVSATPFRLAQTFSLKSSEKIAGPGFMNLLRNPQTNELDLFISTFQMFGKDQLFFLPSVQNFSSAFNVKSVDRLPLVWPNHVSREELNGESVILVAGGFLPPGKNNGGVWYSKYSDSLELKNLVFTKGWFYHKAIAYDVDKDGQDDILTCRAHKPMFGSSGGKLVYLKAPEWKEIELADGCDVYFTPFNMNGKEMLIATDFFTKKQITLFWSPDNNFSKSIRSVVIDNTIGSPFDIFVQDLNNDGKPDLIATNHAKRGEKPTGAVYVYQIPEDPINGKWERTTLVQDIPVRQDGQFEAAPGSAKPFFPHAGLKKPYIMIAGDGSQQATMLVPTNDDDTSFEYKEVLVHDCKSVVGGIDIGDVDGDGFAEVFIPCYYSGKVHMYSFGP